MLEIAPNDIEVVSKLRDLYRRRHDSEQHFKTLERELELAQPADGKSAEENARSPVEILHDLARLAQDELLQPELAVSFHRQVLDLEPTDESSLASLQRLHAEQEDWVSYVSVLEQRVNETRAKAAKLPLLLELGEAVLTRLGDVDRAEQIFATIAESTPTSATARRFLQRIFVSRQKWDELARLFAKAAGRGAPAVASRWKEYVSFLKDAAKHEPDPPLLSAIHIEVARVLEHELDDKKGAAEHIELALKAVEDQVELARRHRGLLGDESAPMRRLVPLTTLARHSAEADERYQSWVAIGHIHRRAKDPIHACDAWGRALVTGARSPAALGPDGARTLLETLALLEADAGATGRWEHARNAIDEALFHLPASELEVRIAMHRTLGSIARARLMEPEEAIRHLKWVLQLAPGDGEALEELEKIHFSKNDFEGLEEVYRARVEAAQTTGDRVEALRKLARLFDEVMLDAERSAEAHTALLRLVPEDAAALSALVTALEQTGAWAELANTLEGALARTADPAERDRYQFKLVFLWADRLGDPLAAVEHARDLVERLDPIGPAGPAGPAGPSGQGARSEDFAALVALLERYTAETVVVPEAIGALETAYRRTGRLVELHGLLEKKAATASQDELPPLLDELAILAEAALNSPERAFKALSRRFDLAPGDPELWVELERLCGLLSAWEELAALYQARLEAEPAMTRPMKASLRLRLADIYHRRLIELEEAIVETERALADTADEAEELAALESLEVLFKKTADLDSFVRVKIESSRRVLSRSNKRQKLMEAASALAGALGRTEEAVALLEPLWFEAPGDTEVVEAILGFVERLGDASRTDELYTDAIEAAPDKLRRDGLRLRRAMHRRDKLDLWEVAISELIDLVGSEAVGRDARRTLLDISRAQESEAQRDVILEVLVDYYRQTRDAEGLINALVVQAEFAPAGVERARALVGAALACLPPLEQLVHAARQGAGAERSAAMAPYEESIRTHPEEAQQAFDLLTQALFEHPGGPSGIDDLGLLLHMKLVAHAAGLWPELAEALETVAQALVGSPEEAAQTELVSVVQARRLLREEAELLEHELGDEARAIDVLQRDLAIADARQESDIEETLLALDRLYRRAENADARREVLVRLAGHRTEPVDRAEAYEALALLELEIGRSDEAALALEQALSELGAADRLASRPMRQRILGTLESVLMRDSRFEELVELLVEAAATELDPSDQRELLLRAAEFSSDRLGDRERAVGIYRRLITVDPSDELALTQLVELETQLGDWAEVINALRLLRAIAERAQSDREIREFDHRIGLIQLDQLHDAGQSLVSFAAVLASEPGHVAALDALARIEKTDLTCAPMSRRLVAEAHRNRGAHAELAPVLERIATFDAPGSELHLELAELWLGPLDNTERAWPQLARGYALDAAGPAGARCRDLLLTLGAAASRLSEPQRGDGHRRLVEVLTSVSDQLPQPQRRARKDSDLLALNGLMLDESSLVPMWRSLVHETPPPIEVLDLLEAYARKSNDAALLADALASRAADLAPTERAPVELELAKTLATLPTRRANAVDVLDGLLAREPDNLLAFDLLDGLLMQLERHQERAALLVTGLSRLEHSDDLERRQRLRTALANEAWQHLDQASLAVELLGEVLAETTAPLRHGDAITLLETIWAEGVERPAIYRLLEPSYESSESWDKLVALYMSSLEQDEPELQFECLTKLAALERVRLDRPDAAFSTMVALLERLDDDSPRLPTLLDDLEALAASLGRWDELVDRLEAMIGLGRGGAPLMARLATIYETKRGNDERAAHFYRFAFERAPDDLASRDGLSALLERTKRWRDLAQHLVTAADLLAPEDPDRHQLLLRAAKTLETEIDSPSEALELLLHIVSEAAPESRITLESHDRIAAIYERLEDFESLHYHYRSWLEDAPNDEVATETRVRLGRSLIRFPASASEGLTELEEVLRTVPSRRDVVPALWSMLVASNRMEADPEGLDPSYAVATADAARLLEEVLGSNAPPSTQSELVEAQLRVLPDGAERQAMLTRMADLMLQLDQSERAFSYFAEVLRGEPGSLEVETSLETLAESKRYWEPLASLYEELVLNGDAEDAQRYGIKVARILHQRLDRLEDATIWYERHLALAPHSRDAVEPLATYYREVGDAASEARILETWIDYSATPDELPELRKRLGVLRMDQLGDVQGAIDALEGCLPEGATDSDLVKRLERLYVRGEHFPALVELYLAVLAQAPTDKERLETLAKMAQVYELRLADLPSARETGRKMLALDATNRFALTSLERIERALGDWDAVDEILAKKLEVTQADGPRIKLFIDRAEVAETHRGRHDEALEFLLAADRLVGPGPGPDELIKGLEGLLRSEASIRLQAARALGKRYRARQAWQSVINSLMIELVVSPDRGDHFALASQASEIAIDRLGDRAMALRVLVTALRQAPEAPDLRALVERIARENEDFGPVLKLGDDLMKKGLPAAAAVGFASWLGGLERAHGLLDRAVRSFERVLDVEPGNSEAGDQLAALYRDRGDWSSLRGLYRQRLAVTPTTDHPLLELDLALHLAAHEGVEATIGAVNELLDAHSNDPRLKMTLVSRIAEPVAGAAATATLAARLREQSRFSELVKLLEQRAEKAPDAAEASRLLREAAVVSETAINDRIAAVKLLGRASLSNPDDLAVWRQFRDLAHRIGAWDELARVLALGVNEASPEPGAELALWLAELQAEKLTVADGLERAVATLRAASDRLPLNIPLRQRLIAYETARGDVAAAEDEVAALVELLDDSELERSYWRSLRNLAEHKGDEVRVVIADEAILARDHRDTEAAEHLAAFYRRSTRWEDLAELLFLRIEAAESSHEAAAFWAEIASLRMGPLADSEGARDAWQEAWNLDPAHPEATRKVAQFLAERGEWGEAAALWESHADALGSGEDGDKRQAEIAQAWIEVARIREDRQKAPAEAVDAYELALESDPTALTALNALIGLHGRGRRYVELADAIERKARAVPQRVDKTLALVQAAAVHLDQLRDPASALPLLDEVLTLDADHLEGRLLLARLHMREGRATEAITTIEELAQRTEGKRKVRLLMDLARLYLGQEGGAMKAVASVDEALTLDPQTPGLESLTIEVLEAAKLWERLQGALERAYTNAKSDKERAERALAMARIFAGPVPDLERLATWIGKTRAADPQSEDAMMLEADAMLTAGRLEEAEALLTEIVAILEQKRAADALVIRSHQLGQLRVRLGRIEGAHGALVAFERAHDLDGKYVPNLLDYGRALVHAARWAEALVIHQALLLQRQAIPDEDERFAILERLALASWEANQKERARAYLSRLLSEKADHPGGLALKARFAS